MGSKRRFRIGAILLPLLTVLLRVVWLSWFRDDPVGPVDAEGYHLMARNLLAGRGFSMVWTPPFCPTSLRPPLYVIFLSAGYSLLGLDPARVVLLQVLLEALTTALVMRLGWEVSALVAQPSATRRLRVAGVAGLFYALNGTTQRYTGLLFSETLLLTLLAAALWVTVMALHRRRPPLAALAGGAWGITLLVKPNVQFLALSIGGLFLGLVLEHVLATRKLSSICLLPFAFFGGLLLVLAPWLIRNHNLWGRWMLTTAFEENLARVSAVATMAEVRKQPAEPWTPTWEFLYGELLGEASQRYGWDARVELALSCEERAVRHRQVAVVAREVIAAHPRAFLRSHGRGVIRSLLDVGHRFWYRVLTDRVWDATGVLDNIWRRMEDSLRIGAVGDALHVLWLERVQRAPLDAALVWWGLLFARIHVWVWGVRGWWRLRKARWAALALAGTVLYFLILPGPIAYDRFYLPAIPAVVVLFALGCEHCPVFRLWGGGASP